MIEQLYTFAAHQLENNQFFTGILGGVVLTGLGVAFRSIPNKIYTRIHASLISTLSLNSAHHAYYDEVSNYISQFVIQRYNRAYTMSDGKNLVTGYGNAFGFFEGVFFLRTRNEQDNKYSYQETLSITFFTRNRVVLERFLAQALQPKDADLIKITNFDYSGYAGQVKRPKRDLDTVFVNADTKTKLVENLHRFYQSEDRYKARGINYKYCVLLHGKPGTGKTTLIAAVAAHFNVDLNIVDHFEGIKKAANFSSDHGTKRSIIVVEDIDTMVLNLNREKNSDQSEPEVGPSEPKSDKLDSKPVTANALIHDLLQTLDGFSTPWGMVVFITTNYIDRLDPALIRPGRVDYKAELTYLEQREICEMFQAFYGRDDNCRTIIEDYVNGSNYRPQRGAYLQSVFLEESDPVMAVAKLRSNLDYKNSTMGE